MAEALKQNKAKLYVLVRRDLPRSYRMIQGTHAAVLYSSRVDPYSSADWRADTGTIVALLVNDEDHLRHIQGYMMKTIGVPVASWCEPDLNNELTAIAFVDKDAGEPFVSGLRLA